jgi:hypothetical protein
MTSRTSLPLLAAAALLAVAPAAADAKRKPIKKPAKLVLSAKPDPLAPQGRTPKVLFSLDHAVKGREYRLMAKQVRGQQARPGGPRDTPVCTPALGSTTPVKALFNGRLPFDRTPFDLSEASDGYAVIAGEPCTGVYEGSVEELGKRSIDFVLSVPEMTVDVVARYG